MIVTADDFGYDGNRNRAIVLAFERGLITHASLMANMPGFEEACELAHELQLVDRIGAHVVLSEGRPLTEPVRRVRRFCDESGTFRDWGDRRVFFLGGAEREAVQTEWRAQIERCRRHGIALSHADSHHHIHNEPPLGRTLVALARGLGIPRVRIARNCGGGIGPARRVYKAAFNAFLRRQGVARSRYFGDFDDLAGLAQGDGGADRLDAAELMTHPMLDENGRLVDELRPATPFEELVQRVRPAAAP